MSGKRETVKDKVAKVDGLLQRNKATILDVLPRHVDGDRMLKVMFNSVRINPALLDADPASLMAALINSGTLGLEPDTPLGHSYMIPFKRQIVLVVGYKGLVALATRSGAIKSVSVNLVYEGEHFDYYESERGTVLEHKPLPPTARGGDIIAGYCRIVFPDGTRPDPVVMWKDEIDKVRASSRAGGSGPWKDWYEEMAKKTVLRRAFKYLDIDPTVNRAVAVDEQYEAGLAPRDFTLAGEEVITSGPVIDMPVALPEPPDEEIPNAPQDEEPEKKEEKKEKGKAKKKKDSRLEKEHPELYGKIRDLGLAMERPPLEIETDLADCKDEEDLETLRKRYLKEYNASVNAEAE
jgi:recombination protein RecT